MEYSTKVFKSFVKYLKGTVTEKRNGELGERYTSTSSRRTSQSWTRLKPGVWNSIQISHVSDSDPGNWFFLHYFPKRIISELF